jgi:CubicO group peptidase (beta-lactamase class C family)
MRALAVVTLAAALTGTAPLTAQTLPHSTPIDGSAVAAFADEFFPREMARRQIPGVVFVLVSGGEITIARGFGAAQLEPRRPVDPDRTRFRLASVSKAITATAALQLVERGRLDLHANVNTYLRGFEVGDRGPITLHHLLTHTAGFDERLIGIAARSADEVQPLPDYLARSMPPTFIEPGRVISYSNHGLALVGLLIQQVSGRPFADYIRDEIFEPLAMRRSGALVGPPPDDLAVAYHFADGRHRAMSPEYLQGPPAGAFFTTGSDMGRFLIAHLRDGAYRERRMLRPETVALMHAQHFAQVPGTSGWAYGLWEDARNGERALLHNGGGKGYRALMYLLPQRDAGFFLAYNLADRHDEGELQEVFITQFRKRFIPGRVTADTGAPRESVAGLKGDYLYVRRARTTPEKMIAVVNRVRITDGENGGLTLIEPSGNAVALTPVRPLVFRRADDRGTVAFDGMTNGRAQRLISLVDSGFPAAFERIPLLATLRVHVGWVAAMALVFLYAAVWRPVAAIVRRHHATTWDWQRASLWLGGLASALNLVFLAGFPLAFLGRMEGGFPEFAFGEPALASRLLYMPPLTAFIGVAAVIAAGAIWRDRRASVPTRLVHVLVAITLVAFTMFAWYWRLIS